MIHRFTSYVNYNLTMKLPIWASMFLNETLVSANCYKMVVLFSTMAKKCSYKFLKKIVLFFKLIMG